MRPIVKALLLVRNVQQCLSALDAVLIQDRHLRAFAKDGQIVDLKWKLGLLEGGLSVHRSFSPAALVELAREQQLLSSLPHSPRKASTGGVNHPTRGAARAHRPSKAGSRSLKKATARQGAKQGGGK